ncbi:hypothetical protein SAMN05192569_10063 [Parageobacillus thermantarcticus]|uniref:Uncharacterized protein n=1 Tax=Parageobacillus thermantarcticus TaxID=186116 RepID=A0A1I0SVF9_9BACL|nr:hypothetical protein SAMN05192569_10063 [Parageobacillus thermantarcticus]
MTAENIANGMLPHIRHTNYVENGEGHIVDDGDDK